MGIGSDLNWRVNRRLNSEFDGKLDCKRIEIGGKEVNGGAGVAEEELRGAARGVETLWGWL